MRVVILQPGYLPWLGFFEQFERSDLFVMYDDAQFDRRGWRHRNRIKTATGVQWLTVPVLKKGLFTQTIRETRIDPTCAWQRHHLGRLRSSYAHAAFFEAYYPGLERLLQLRWTFLMDLDLALIEQLLHWLGLAPSWRLASEIGGSGHATQRLYEICRAVGASEYLTGDSASAYFDEALFARNGIRLEYQQYRHPMYHQLFGRFVSHLSALDLLFNHGPESLAILTGRTSVPTVAPAFDVAAEEIAVHG